MDLLDDVGGLSGGCLAVFFESVGDVLSDALEIQRECEAACLAD